MIDEDFYVYFHDCFLEVTEVSLSQEEIEDWYKYVPDSIKNIASEWGWNDTVVGDKLYEYLLGHGKDGS